MRRLILFTYFPLPVVGSVWSVGAVVGEDVSSVEVGVVLSVVGVVLSDDVSKQGQYGHGKQAATTIYSPWY